jgi:hypothetical protein
MNQYSDIINIPHFEFKKHQRMSIESRASTFSPFAALTGFADSINETSRLTEEKKLLSEDMKSIIDMKLQIIMEHIKEKPEIIVYYFIKDIKKNGGSYKEYKGNIRKIDIANKKIVFIDKKEINLDDIYDIIFNE